ncbi:Uncharacterised protein [Burkholderia pseudomallei]|nr:Uncharacterised protein [Burkholderia pseudomallei]
MPSRNDGSWRTIRSRRFCIRDTSQKTASVAPATSAAQAASSPPRRPAHSVATAVVAASAASGARISDTPARFDTFSHASAARSRQRASPSAGFSARAPPAAPAAGMGAARLGSAAAGIFGCALARAPGSSRLSM